MHRPGAMVLLDATPACLETSARGIGRFVACLLPRVADSLRDLGWEPVEAGLGSDSLVPGIRRVSIGNRLLFRKLSPWQRQLAFSGRFAGVARSVGASALLATDTSLFPAPVPGVHTALMMYDLIPLLDRESYLDTFGRGDRWLWTRRLPRRWREADTVFAITHEVARTAREIAQVPPESLRVVYPGVDHIPGADPHVSCGIDRPFFLHVGAIESRKNVERLVHAFARFHANDASGAVLALAGPMAPFRRRMVERWAAEAGVPDHVILLGRVEDDRLQALYRGCIAFAFPSLLEGFGLPPLEAMRTGAAVLASRSSCMPEVLGEDALWVDGRDVDDIARGLGQLASDAALRGRLAAAGPARAARYSWKDAGRAIAERLVEGRTPR